MIPLYLYDSQFIYSSSGEYDPMKPIPPMSTSVVSPMTTGTEVAQWKGSGWVVLPERPPTPEPAPEPVPEEIEGWQAEVIMRLTPVDLEDEQSQNVWDRVQDIITAMPDGSEKVTAQIVLQRGKLRRDSAMLSTLAPLVPLTDDRVDSMFRLGAAVEA